MVAFATKIPQISSPDVGRHVLAYRQMKMAACLTRDIKREAVKLSFHSVTETVALALNLRK